MSSSDSDSDDSIESIVLKEQEIWRSKAKSVTFKGKTARDLLTEARRIDRQREKEALKHDWANVYYLLHLYMEIALTHNLHKLPGGENAANSSRVLDNLKRMEKRMDLAKKGMLWQFKNMRDAEAKGLEERRLDKFKRDSESAAVAALAVTTGAAATSAAVAAANIGAMSHDQITAALDALRLPGDKISTEIPALALPMVKPIVHDIPPPPYSAEVVTLPASPPAAVHFTAPVKHGGMSTECNISAAIVKTLILKTVPGDGSCAFRSIAQGMNHGRLTNGEEKAHADQLRKLAVRLLRERGDEEMVGTGMSIEQVVLMKDSFGSYDTYCLAMAKSEYAGETEFWLLAEELEIRIAIFMSSDDSSDGQSGGLEHMITYGIAQSTPVCLFWQRGGRSELGNHYDCLLPEGDVSDVSF